MSRTTVKWSRENRERSSNKRSRSQGRDVHENRIPGEAVRRQVAAAGVVFEEGSGSSTARSVVFASGREARASRSFSAARSAMARQRQRQAAPAPAHARGSEGQVRLPGSLPAAARPPRAAARGASSARRRR